MNPFKYAIALTGGISTGKSTVSNILKLYGLRLIDADKSTHKILDKEYKEIASIFGHKYIKNNKVDREELAKLIFNNKKEREKLESFIHPLIFEDIKEQSIQQDKLAFPYIIDIPLFFEKKTYINLIKNSLVVYSPKEEQIKRLSQRDKIDMKKAKAKVELQIDIEKKKKLSTWVIDNSKDLKNLALECENFMNQLEKKFLGIKLCI